MIDKWFVKRDFSIPNKLLQGPLLKALQAKPFEKTLFWDMWTECQDIAQAVLKTDYFQGIAANNLHPKAFGSLMVQDAYYCISAQNSYAAAATHAMDEQCRNFILGKCESYKEYNESYHTLWHIRDMDGVIPGPEIKDYAAYESYVAGNLDSPYLFCVMLPCEYLWTWVANTLKKSASSDGLYYFWIEENEGSANGAIQMANMLENYREKIDISQAKGIFRKAMENEYKVFNASTLINNNLLWQKKNSI